MLRTVWSAIFLCAAALAQGPSFDVASAKETAEPILMTRPQITAGRFRWTSDLQYLIAYAYGVSRSRLAGPVPGSDHIYVVEATMMPDANEDQIRLMLQRLLAERFSLHSHRQMKEANGYALVVNKGGLKLPEAKAGEAPPPMPEWMGKVSESGMDGRVIAIRQAGGVTAVTGRRITMAQLAAVLETSLDEFVTDATALPGRYYVAFRFASVEQPDREAASLFAALQDLGLKLEKRKGPVEVIVVDHVETTPVGN